MRNGIIYLTLFLSSSLASCVNTSATQDQLLTAFNVAAAVESAYAADPNSNPDHVKQAAALLSSAQAALLAWQNAPPGSTAEATALTVAIAALVAFEAQIHMSSSVHQASNDLLNFPARCADMDEWLLHIAADRICGGSLQDGSDGVHRG